jgi:hypothetical protein
LGEIVIPVETPKCRDYYSGDYRSTNGGYQDHRLLREFAEAVRIIVDNNFGKDAKVVFYVTDTSSIVLATACMLLNHDRHFRLQNVEKAAYSRMEDEYTIFVDDHIEMGTSLKHTMKQITPEVIDLAIVMNEGGCWDPDAFEFPIVSLRHHTCFAGKTL